MPRLRQVSGAESTDRPEPVVEIAAPESFTARDLAVDLGGPA